MVILVGLIENHEYLWTDGTTVLYVGRELGRYDFRVFTGLLGAPLREVEVTQSTRLRDGGTTYISTVEGQLVAQRPATYSWMGSTDFPVQPCRYTWDDGRPPLELPRVDPDAYVISIDSSSTTVIVSDADHGPN
ncbi:MAG TPA: hypothetical protein VM820_08495 [Vicinamibacterales bacterium]|nr:hypothetical protein [Vicinamibacterales bacterium]